MPTFLRGSFPEAVLRSFHAFILLDEPLLHLFKRQKDGAELFLTGIRRIEVRRSSTGFEVRQISSADSTPGDLTVASKPTTQRIQRLG
ncbi:hypothetical protein SISSUDRAFT_1048358 [Sistotremastrum suecicum HHB10207 ss-3]|uniref:Uncharacterized protein n=1 Tax=Sistotremastrum suecicum HHB10207 ss-3 TaxID=1314776 RepID=A0A166CIX8_9AGAM|nr:hypothetical protein SISSUDRAFT_1048358 [Sistotremastrum suecicum HHB10207 ss-3]